MTDEGKSLAELARTVAQEDVQTLRIVLVPHAHASGILVSLLTRSFGIPRKNITQLGYTASDEQNDMQLQKAKLIVLVPIDILIHRPCKFYPPPGTTRAKIIYGTTEPPLVSYRPCTGEPFEIKLTGLP